MNRTSVDTDLVRRLDLGVPEHRAIANKLDGLRSGRAFVPAAELEALAAIDAEIESTIRRAEQLIAEHAAAVASAPKCFYDHHGSRVGRA